MKINGKFIENFIMFNLRFKKNKYFRFERKSFKKNEKLH